MPSLQEAIDVYRTMSCIGEQPALLPLNSSLITLVREEFRVNNEYKSLFTKFLEWGSNPQSVDFTVKFCAPAPRLSSTYGILIKLEL